MPTIRYGEIGDMRMVTGPVRQPTVSSVGTVPVRRLKQLSGIAAVSNRRPTLHVWLHLPMALHVSRATLNSIKHSAYTNGLPNQLADQRLASDNQHRHSTGQLHPRMQKATIHWVLELNAFRGSVHTLC